MAPPSQLSANLVIVVMLLGFCVPLAIIVLSPRNSPAASTPSAR
jgi:hypothetical protein